MDKVVLVVGHAKPYLGSHVFQGLLPLPVVYTAWLVYCKSLLRCMPMSSLACLLQELIEMYANV